MWLISVAPLTLIISEHSKDVGTIQDTITNGVANMYSAMGWSIFRTPAENSGSGGKNGVHYTYTNAVIVNQIVLLPTFSSQSNSWNNQARNVSEELCSERNNAVQEPSDRVPSVLVASPGLATSSSNPHHHPDRESGHRHRCWSAALHLHARPCL